MWWVRRSRHLAVVHRLQAIVVGNVGMSLNARLAVSGSNCFSFLSRWQKRHRNIHVPACCISLE